METQRAIEILHVCSEIHPLNKVGGLGDVTYELPKAINGSGEGKCVVIAPLNKPAKTNIEKLSLEIEKIGEVCVPLNWRCYKLPIFKLSLDEKLNIYLIGGDIIENSPPYPEKEEVSYKLSFPLLCLGAIEGIKERLFEITPHLIHVHDWPTSLIPIFKYFHRYYREIPMPPTILSIHNIAHQGIYEPEVIDQWYLLSTSFDISYLEFWGKVNLLKGGIILSDAIVTVSQSYAEEIQKPEYGFGLDGVVREQTHKLYGITNGIDEERWNPATDEFIPFRYDDKNMEGKKRCKKALLKELALEEKTEKPLISMISRIASQKGFDILIPAIPEILKMETQLVILGKGDPYFSKELATLERGYAHCYRFINDFDESLARRIYAGSDMLLMPSLYEPCGITQMIALRYGTLPIARRVGGLKDTIKDIDDDGWGFLFDEYSQSALIEAVRKAINIYRNEKTKFNEAIRKAMRLDFSWSSRAKLYLEVYRKVAKKR
ncbi:MAG: starch synthase [bacterium]|nr:starch synthase [bacterium]